MDGMRAAFARTASDLLDEDPRVALVLAEISVDGYFSRAVERHPERAVNIGIAEQAMVGVAAGFAMEGFHPIAHSIGAFVAERPYEQLKLDIGYQGLGGTFVGVGGSYDYAAEGATHHAPADAQVMTAIPRMQVLAPGHAREVDALLRATYANGEPTYLRLGRPRRTRSRSTSRRDGSRWCARGAGPTVVAFGPMLWPTLPACAGLDVTIRLRHEPAAVRRRRHSRPWSATHPVVVAVEPWYEGTAAAAVTAALAHRPRAVRLDRRPARVRPRLRDARGPRPRRRTGPGRDRTQDRRGGGLSTMSAAAPAAPPRWRDVFRGPQGRLIVGLLVLETLFALHFLTVATVMPAVLDDLGDISLYGASFWAASLMQLAVHPDRERRPSTASGRGASSSCWPSSTRAGCWWPRSRRRCCSWSSAGCLQGVAAGAGYALSIGVVAKQMPEEHRAPDPGAARDHLDPAGAAGARRRRAARLDGGMALGVRGAAARPRDLSAADPAGAPGDRARRAMTSNPGAAGRCCSRSAASRCSRRSPSRRRSRWRSGAAGASSRGAGCAPSPRRGPSARGRDRRAAAAAAFLSSVTFAAADSFVSLMLTDVRGLSIAAVGIGFTFQTFAWTIGSWWQSRQVERRSLGRAS